MSKTLAGKPYSECSNKEIAEDLYDPDTAIQQEMEYSWAWNDMIADQYYELRRKHGLMKTKQLMLELDPDYDYYLEELEEEFQQDKII